MKLWAFGRKSDDASNAVLSHEPATLAAARRSRLVASIVLIAVISSVLGWIAGSAIQSPSANARAEPPEASLITAPVERRVLTSSVIVRGEGRYSAAADIVVDADLGEEGSTVVRPVVTGRIPVVSADLADGAVALEVSGRPVFLLQGSFPMYRRLRPDTAGPDVRQLEEALRRLGFFAGAPDDVLTKPPNAA